MLDTLTPFSAATCVIKSKSGNIPVNELWWNA
jgi:hypothetical protein